MNAGRVKLFPRREMLDLVVVDGHARGIMGLRFIKALEPPVVTVYRLPLEALRRDGWAALKSAIVYEGDQTD